MGNIVIRADRAAYRIMDPKGFYADDFLYQQGSVIYWDGIPNEQMEPLNELARIALTEYIDDLELKAMAVAEKTGRPYTPRHRGTEGAVAIATLDSRRPELVRGDGGIPLMGAKPRGPKKSAVIEAEPDAPVVVGRPGKHSVSA